MLENVKQELEAIMDAAKSQNPAVKQLLENIASDLEEAIQKDDVQEDDLLPDTYAEIDYGDREDAEAIDGAIWDDKNFRYYTER